MRFLGAIIAYKWFTPRLEMRIQSLYIITLCCTCLLVTAGTILDLFTVYIAEWSLFRYRVQNDLLRIHA